MSDDNSSDSDWLPRRNRRKKAVKYTKPSEWPLLDNSILPCVPFPVRFFQDLFSLSELCNRVKVIYKDCCKLGELYPDLKLLHQMVGLEPIKNQVCDMIIYHLVNKNHFYWKNFVISGPPGTGKTTIARIIGKIFCTLAEKQSCELVIGSTRNMISDWQGQTKTLVHNLVEHAVATSGVLLIDEAPNLNDGRKHASPDSYGKSCIDTLMEKMDEHQNNLVVGFAGYKNELLDNVINTNPGLKRRIQWWFHIENYDAQQLHMIFQSLLQKNHKQIPDSTVDQEWFERHYQFFPHYGGSVENFFEKIMVVHTKKQFGFERTDQIHHTTLLEAFQLYKELCFNAGVNEIKTKKKQKRKRNE